MGVGMNAINFVKDKGLLFAIDVLQNSPDDFPEIVVDSDGVSYGIGLVPFVGGYHILRDDLKQIVEAFELVDRYGGLNGAKNWINNVVSNESMSNIMAINSDLSKAINLVGKFNDR